MTRSSRPAAQHSALHSEPEFRAHLDSLFDAGMDPIDDPRVQAFLTDHPKHLEAFAQERADILLIRDGIVNGGSRVARLKILAAVAAAVLMLVWAGTLWLGSDEKPTRGLRTGGGLRVFETKIVQRSLTSSPTRTTVDTRCRHETAAPRFHVRITDRVHRIR